MEVYNSLSRFNDQDLPKNFVSIAVQIRSDDLIPVHAGILIRYKSINYLHHFPGSTPPVVEDNFDQSGWYVYKILDFFNYNDESEIGAMLQYCRRICRQSQITYSFIADGSDYDDNGEFNSKHGLPEFGTCVGFCLNTLANALIDVEISILEFDDWDDNGIDERLDMWSREKALNRYPDLDWSLYDSFKKRVTPLEYLCSAYFNNYPIKKADIDLRKNQVLTEIQLIYLN